MADIMGKLTRGDKNALKAQAYRERYEKVLPFGYTIKKVRFAGDYEYYIHLNGTCIHPGSVYEYHENALADIEKLIDKNKI